ncbi:MAG: Lrp/AsnC family transcriptional regulator [Candidatus Njordarchaeota archaeon]
MRKISDYDLLMLLRKNARASYTELAKHFGVSDTAIRKRIKKLEDEKVIIRYTVEIDPKKIGFNIVALIGIDTLPEQYISIIEDLKKRKDVISMYSSTGDHMILIECWFRNSDELTKFVKDLEKMRGVTKICPAIILEKIK